MPKKLILTHPYRQLMATVQKTFSKGLIEAQRALEYQRLKTYWQVGADIRKIVDRSDGQIQLGSALYERLSRDLQKNIGLDISTNTIQRAIQFNKTYPQFPAKTSLTFTHYLALMRVTDARQRRQLENQAAKKGMSSYELKTRILQVNTLNIPAKVEGKPLPVERGEPYVYLARPFGDLGGKEQMCVDCGFKIHLPFSGIILKKKPHFTPGKIRYVRMIKTGEEYDARLAVRKRAMLYTYAARVLRVVDGDTLDALIDVGFGIRVHERFRLKGINAPESATPAGQMASRFLTDHLKKCPAVIVRTSKAGMYGRWLGDIFAKPGCRDPFVIASQGAYINQLLLDEGIVEKYS